MVIQNMFVEDINRKINGVVKVDEDENKVLEQELNEYVITRELKRHFADFFNTYAEAFDEPTADTGVWISGFFGSGKSHFLKMLSYLLENKEVNGIRTVERFRKKFEDDPGTFMQVDRATKGETETILFNIDYEGSINKDKTAVLRVFANAVRRMVDGYLKLMYPDGVFDKSELEEVLQISLEMRRRVKEQLKKLGGMEFYDVNFSYIDLEDMSEHYVSVPEQGGGKLIPDGMCNPGQVYTVSRGKSGMIGVFRLESQMLPGSGKFERTGLGSDRDCKESTNTAFNFLKANGKRISGGISTASKDYIINYQDLQGIGMTGKLALPTLIALCSIALGRPTVSTLAVLGEISISGTILKVDELANSLQVCLDSGAKKVLLPITSAADLGTVPPELVGSFNLIFYSSAEDAVFKALGVE